MSGKALSWAFSQSIPPHVKFTLVALADAQNHKTGQCNPSLPTLAAKVSKTVRAVQHDLDWLESHDYIRRQFRRLPKGGYRSTFYVLPVHHPGEAQFTTLVQSTAPHEPELEPELEPQQAALTSSAEQESKSVDAYEDIWGSAVERDAERRAKEQREAKERTARARQAALAALPRSQWRPGHLENFFRSQVTALSLPRQPQLDRAGLRGGFGALLANGNKAEELASAIEKFCEDRTLWSDLVERQGAPIWKVFLKLAPTLTARAATPVVSTNHVSQNRLPGRRW